MGQDSQTIQTPFLRSKTLVANMVLAAGAEFWPTLNSFITTHPHTALLACCGLNFVLRHFTGTGISYAKKPVS